MKQKTQPSTTYANASPCDGSSDNSDEVSAMPDVTGQLAVADQMIDKILSKGISENYLESMRQLGGQ